MLIGNRAFDESGTPHIVGVVNLSPESPNKDSVASSALAAVERARLLAEQGAKIIDVGAQSSYFATPLLSADAEAARLIPAIRALKESGFLVSVDTFRAEVAARAIAARADVINDSDGFQDAEMMRVLAAWGGPVIIPFISGPNPHDPIPFNYEDPLGDIFPFLELAIDRARNLGLQRILLDPGTGYRYPDVSPEVKERYQVKVYAALPQLRALGFPILVALPRKEDPARTLELVRQIARCADFVRAHDPTVLTAAVQTG
jgi:dihydropteroate synthase